MTSPSPESLGLQDQEIPLDDPRSRFHFRAPFVSTRRALSTFGAELLLACLLELQAKAVRHDGLDYLQVFVTPEELPNLWFIESGDLVTALLPEEY